MCVSTCMLKGQRGKPSWQRFICFLRCILMSCTIIARSLKMAKHTATLLLLGLLVAAAFTTGAMGKPQEVVSAVKHTMASSRVAGAKQILHARA